MAKPAREWPLGARYTPLHKMIGYCDLFGTQYYGSTECGVFKRGVEKLERFLPKNQHSTQRKLLNFENWVDGKVSESAKVWLLKSIFYDKSHCLIILNSFSFFSSKNTKLGAHFLLLTFLDSIDFFIKFIIKIMPNFRQLAYVDS